MKPHAESDRSPLAVEILDYLARHPDARDTVEGIVQWWLLEHRVQRTVGEVRAALAELVERGIVQACPQRDGRVGYALNRQRKVEGRRFLKLSQMK